MTHPEYRSEEKGASDALPGNLKVEDGTIEVLHGGVWGDDAVKLHNSLMFKLAQDTIVAPTKEALDAAVGETLSGH